MPKMGTTKRWSQLKERKKKQYGHDAPVRQKWYVQMTCIASREQTHQQHRHRRLLNHQLSDTTRLPLHSYAHYITSESARDYVCALPRYRRKHISGAWHCKMHCLLDLLWQNCKLSLSAAHENLPVAKPCSKLKLTILNRHQNGAGEVPRECTKTTCQWPGVNDHVETPSASA